MKKYLNRVALHTATEGQGTLALGSPISDAFLTPAEAGGANGDKVSYIIEEGLDFEIGVGTLSVSGESLMRDTVTVSKIGGTASTTKMDLSGAAIVRFIAAGDDYIRHPDSVTPMSPVWFSTSAGNVLGMGEVVSPSEITVNQHDYNPTGLSTAVALRLTSDAERSITGLEGGAAQRAILILNVGSHPIIMRNESSSSSAGNRLSIGGDLAILPGMSMGLVYDGASSRWRLTSMPGSLTETNANGTFTRFPDGRMEARRQAEVNLTSTSAQIFDMPAAFVDAPAMGWRGGPGSIAGGDTSASANGWMYDTQNPPNSRWIFRSSSSGDTNPYNIQLWAIGRWF